MTHDEIIVAKIPLPRAMPPVLGVGAYLKNAVCLIQGAEAWIGRDNGSLDSVEAISRFQESVAGMLEQAAFAPVAVAHDWHPDFYPTKWAQAFCERTSGNPDHPPLAGGSKLPLGNFGEGSSFEAEQPLPENARAFSTLPQGEGDRDCGTVDSWHDSGEIAANSGEILVNNRGVVAIGIQHHHAHVAAVMAEQGGEGPVLGLALDGFGLGANNEAWGGELLQVDRDGFKRIGHLRNMPQPSGDLAARQPWRMGAAALWSLGRGEEIASMFAGQAGADMLATMMDRELNAPMTSSAGRLFDAACGLLGVLPVARFEGEAPMKLEGMVTQTVVDPIGWRIEGGVLDMRPLLAALVGREVVAGANLFHGTLAAALLAWVRGAAEETGIGQVALCGGCFFNKVLREALVEGIKSAGLEPLLPKKMSVGDPAIALGQAYAAGMRG